MFGKVTHYSKATSRGKIQLIDGNIVHFTLDDWQLQEFPSVDMNIDYMRGCITKEKVKTFKPQVKVIQKENKTVSEKVCPDLIDYVEKKVADGYEVISKDDKSFVLKQHYVNLKIYLRAQRWAAYALPFIVALFLYSDATNIPNEFLPAVLAIALLSFLGTLSTLMYQSHKSERVEVKLYGECNLSKFIVDDSQERAYYQ